MVRRVPISVIAVSFLVAFRMAAQCPPTAVVQAPPGATYAWTVDGGEITGDAAGDQITIALGTSATATVAVTATAGPCVAHGGSTITLHDPFVVHPVTPAGHAAEPLTISWSYENGSPAQQIITGTDFGAIALAPDVRSYTYAPSTSGNKQIVIDAAMQQPATPGSSSSSRRRAVSKSPYIASACASVHTAAAYDVGDCVVPPVYVNAPLSVLTGTTFQLSVVSQPGAVASWTIHNGSPATATGESVTVTAGATGNVDVSVQLTRGACQSQTDRSIAITAKPVCNNPKALVSAGGVSCGSAVVNVTFTGTPPFQGMWSDNVPFNTGGTTLTRTVTLPGSYSIVSFQDAACAGTSSGVASFSALGPTATIMGKANSCTGQDSVTVQFTGTPPFFGSWTDRTSFNTSDMQIVMPIVSPGTNTVLWGYDATECRMTVLGSVEGHMTPTVTVHDYCNTPDYDNVVDVYADLLNGTFPFTVTWNDGVTVSDNYQYRYVTPSQTTTYSVVAAHDAYCAAVIPTPPPSVTVYASPIPDFSLGVGNLCAGVTASASLATPPPAGATVQWFVEDGSVLSGQGTSSIQYKTGTAGTMTVGCIFTYGSNRCPTSHRQAVWIHDDPIGAMSVQSPQIHSGGTSLISFTMDAAMYSWTLTDSLNDTITQQGVCGPQVMCQALYTSSHGTGLSTITLQMTGWCNNTKKVFAQVSVIP